MWNVEFSNFDDFLYIHAHDFEYLGPISWTCSSAQNTLYTKTSINQPSDGLYIWLRFHLMWNVEFNFLDDFLCIGVHDLGYLDPICPTHPTSFDVKCGVNTLNDFLCTSVNNVGNLGPISPTCPNSLNILKQV